MEDAKGQEAKISIKKPPVRFKDSQALIKQLEDTLKMPILTYWNSNDGTVCYNDVNAIYEVLEDMDQTKKIGIFVKSGGGNGSAALRIIHLLRQYCKELVAFVPLECASAATMIAIGADQIFMGPMSYLTAVDTSLRHQLSPRDQENRKVSVSLDGVSRVVRLWNKDGNKSQTNPYQSLFDHIHPLVIGEIDRAESLSIRLCEEIMSYHIKDEDLIKSIASELNSNYPSHGYPITLKEACRIGLQAKPMDQKVNHLFLELNRIYSEMGQTAVTDYDEFNYHNHAILNITETKNLQTFYQTDEDWHYIKEERRWSSTNDESAWYRQEMKGKRVVRSKLHFS